MNALSGMGLAFEANGAGRSDRQTPDPPAKITARHVSFRYGSEIALDDVSIPLFLHKITAIMGPSGCGKSTLLRIFNRMYDLYRNQHADGEILLDGVNILGPKVDINILRARVGMVFQQPIPFPMSIFDNVAFGLRLFERLARSELADRVEGALRRAALWDEVKDQLSDSGLALSGGQQQRLCIARAIANSPEVILLDEPCSALDPHSTAAIEESLKELKVDHTIVIVTHNLQQAARLADYAAFMFLGKMVEFGRSEAIFGHPVDPRTQSFVYGRMS